MKIIFYCGTDNEFVPLFLVNEKKDCSLIFETDENYSYGNWSDILYKFKNYHKTKYLYTPKYKFYINFNLLALSDHINYENNIIMCTVIKSKDIKEYEEAESNKERFLELWINKEFDSPNTKYSFIRKQLKKLFLPKFDNIKKVYKDDFKELFYTLKLPEKLIDTKNIENMCNSYVELFIKEERKRLCV